MGRPCLVWPSLANGVVLSVDCRRRRDHGPGFIHSILRAAPPRCRALHLGYSFWCLADPLLTSSPLSLSSLKNWSRLLHSVHFCGWPRLGAWLLRCCAPRCLHLFSVDSFPCRVCVRPLPNRVPPSPSRPRRRRCSARGGVERAGARAARVRVQRGANEPPQPRAAPPLRPPLPFYARRRVRQLRCGAILVNEIAKLLPNLQG